MGLKRVLLIAAVVLFVVAGVGFEALHLGTASFNVVAFGLACFAGSFLAS